ncbi:MAG: class I SAM-dependent methyltransferase [Vicinamibacterales bacterium]
MTERSSISPVARTAFYCCALRADDAERVRPVCGDTFAARFLDDDIRTQLRPMLAQSGSSASNVARHRLIDDALRSRLSADPDLRVILLGAGFDTRAFRMSGGRWWEFDSPELVDFKEQRLPAASAPHPLIRAALEPNGGNLDEALGSVAGDDQAVVVLEGVSMYLTPAMLSVTARAIRRHLPRATLICDLMTPAFCRRFSRSLRKELSQQGVEFEPGDSHPRNAIEGAGYRVVTHASIVGRAREAGTVKVPGWILSTFLRELRDGYQVWTFAPADATNVTGR